MTKTKEDKSKNGKLSLKPLEFDEAVKDILQVKPESKNSNDIETDKKTD